MKQIIGLALVLMFMGGVFLFAPVGGTRASSAMAQNSNSDDTMRGMHMQNHRRHRHHRKHHRHHRRHHRHSPKLDPNMHNSNGSSM